MNVKAVLKLVEDERLRQVDKGFDAAHDDGKTDGQIVLSAVAMVSFHFAEISREELAESLSTIDMADPDASLRRMVITRLLEHYDDPIRRLVIAGALIVAEIQRLQRVQAKKAGQGGATNTAPGPDQ